MRLRLQSSIIRNRHPVYQLLMAGHGKEEGRWLKNRFGVPTIRKFNRFYSGKVI